MNGADEAASLLVALYRDGRHVAALPEAVRPGSRAEGYAIQARLADGETVAGWKIAATSKAGQAHIGVSGPLAGRLFASRLRPEGGRVALGANNMRVAEIEFAFRMARDLPPRAAAYGMEEVLAAVGGLHPSIEIPGSRYRDFVTAGEAQLIADNACADQAVIGPACTADWRALDLSRHPVLGVVSGRETHGVGGNALGDPRAALVWLVNELAGLGLTLAAGQVVMTGTCVVPMPIAPGAVVAGDLGALGRVGVTIGD